MSLSTLPEVRAAVIQAARERLAEQQRSAAASPPLTPEADGGIAWAKRCLSGTRTHPDSWWAKGRAAVPIQRAADGGEVRVGLVTLRDDATRVGLCDHGFDEHGDDLPSTPTVLTGVADDWAAAADETRWDAAVLAARGCGVDDTPSCFGVDGGPSWARDSLAAPAVTMQAYADYCRCPPRDDAPLYIFDPHLATRTFADGGALRAECGPAPLCFSRDAMAGIQELRPLPPSWLLVAAARSGTPIHDHPHTVAWNVLLSGCKLWAILPPGCGRELAEDQGSALGWFLRHGHELPQGTVVVIQRPGETVFVPAGWWHIVLNVEDSTALSSSLALRRDFKTSHAALMAEDPEFAQAWLESVRELGWPARFIPVGVEGSFEGSLIGVGEARLDERASRSM